MDKGIISEEWLEETSAPERGAAEREEVPALAAAAVAGVALAVLLAIAAVFLLGIFIDWRHQRMQQKLGSMKRPRRAALRGGGGGGGGGGGVSIVGAELGPGESDPPALALDVHVA